MEKIAVLITSHNHGQYVEEAIKSVQRAQQAAGEPLEIHLLAGDDASRDDSVNKIHAAFAAYQNETFHTAVMPFEENRGTNAVLNDLIRSTPGDCAYTVVLDADDRLKPEFFKTMLYAIRNARQKNEKIGFVYSNCDLIDPEGNHFNYGLSRPFSKEAYREKSYIPSTSLMLTSLLKGAVPFDESVRKHTKWPRYSKLIQGEEGHEGLYIPVALFDYRQHSNNLSGIGNATLKLKENGGKHRITEGDYFLAGESQQTLDEYGAHLESHGIELAQLRKLAPDLQYKGIDLSSHWGIVPPAVTAR